MIAIGFVALLAGYTFAYWGGNLIVGNHISLACLAFNKGCISSANTGKPNSSSGTNPGGQGNNPQSGGVPSLTHPPTYNNGNAGTPFVGPTQPG